MRNSVSQSILEGLPVEHGCNICPTYKEYKKDKSLLNELLPECKLAGCSKASHSLLFPRIFVDKEKKK